MLKYHLLKAIQSFIFPPGIFIVFLFFMSLFAKKFRAFFLFLTILSYLLTTQFMGNILIKPLEDPYKSISLNQSADAVVVLGGGYYEDSPNLPLSHSSFKRAIYGYELSKKLGLKLLYDGSPYESKNAKKTYLELFGDDKDITYLSGSLNTYENAKVAMEYFQKKGIKRPKIYLVTSAFHFSFSYKKSCFSI